jgi:hypothetical protein
MADRVPAVLDPRLDRLRTVAQWLDSKIRIPGTPIRFGFDAIMDIVPFLGDVAGIGFSSWILLEAARMGASKTTLLRMGWNIGIDALVGAVPGIGVVFDAAWKANDRNIALLERHALEPVATRTASRRFAVVLGIGLLLMLIGAGFLGYWLLHLISGAIQHRF